LTIGETKLLKNNRNLKKANIMNTTKNMHDKYSQNIQKEKYKKNMNSKEKKEIFKFTKEQENYELYIPLNLLWNEYFQNILDNNFK
jgi:hypothetical protein